MNAWYDPLSAAIAQGPDWVFFRALLAAVWAALLGSGLWWARCTDPFHRSDVRRLFLMGFGKEHAMARRWIALEGLALWAIVLFTGPAISTVLLAARCALLSCGLIIWSNVYAPQWRSAPSDSPRRDADPVFAFVALTWRGWNQVFHAPQLGANK